MTKTEIKMLRELASKPDTKGKKLIDQLIWLNTVKPKYKVGDCYEVTDRGHRVFDVPVRNFHARVEEVMYWRMDKLITYKMTAHVKCGDRETDATICAREDMFGRRVEDFINVVDGNPDGSESVDI